MKRISLFLYAVLFISCYSFAQNIGIGTPAPNADAMLDVASSDKGLLIPRLALTATNAAAPLSSFVAGMMVYNTVTAGTSPNDVSPGYYMSDGAGWKKFSGSWLLSGNAGTTAADFIGTTDNVPLNFKVGNLKAGQIGKNVFFGIAAGNGITFGTSNIAMGDSALYTSPTANSSIAIGRNALKLYMTPGQTVAIGDNVLSKTIDGENNTAVGYQAMMNNVHGGYNTAIGNYAMYSNIGGPGGYNNTAVGFEALYSNIGSTANNGIQNTAVGLDALYFNTTGSNNNAMGVDALFANTTGSNNNAFGIGALQKNQSGVQNAAFGNNALFSSVSSSASTAMGHLALQNDISAGEQTAVGSNALRSNTTGNSNTAFGASALRSNTTASNNTALGKYCLFANILGEGNTGAGAFALRLNTAGRFNTAIGDSTLYFNTTGNNNTVLGYNAGLNITASNNVAIGYNAQVPSNSSDNQVRIGDANISYAGIQVAWTITSDSRWKSQIRNSDLGLNFINQLRPVSYFRNNDISEKLEYGFIAQEVEQVLQQSGSVHTGIISKDDKGMYSMRYNDLMAPMVKAIQELLSIVEKQGKEIEELKKRLNK